jgi:hypothetical protein
MMTPTANPTVDAAAVAPFHESNYATRLRARLIATLAEGYVSKPDAEFIEWILQRPRSLDLIGENQTALVNTILRNAEAERNYERGWPSA